MSSTIHGGSPVDTLQSIRSTTHDFRVQASVLHRFSHPYTTKSQKKFSLNPYGVSVCVFNRQLCVLEVLQKKSGGIC
ncbi:hypothetical protein L6452_33593 [Arctium lappa]|uniref:Uncharacterized protein n=1 Tax=Arctium lappa TaxID=4217 RepID=A0ACB8YK20_ARCLA|nr:hypothetical protein L6452_33593 [Arctium lappa]